MRFKRFIIGCMVALMALTGLPLHGGENYSISPTTKKRIVRLYHDSIQKEGGVYVTYDQLGRYVNRVGQSLANVSDAPNLPYEFVVINQMEPNAWALPQGKIAINLGLLLELHSEAELAAVLSHEIGHAVKNHGIRKSHRQTLGDLVVLSLEELLPGNTWGTAAKTAAALGHKATVQKYSRDDELEADALGIKYMARAGYDTSAAVSLQKVFLKVSNGSQSWFSSLFASHPPSKERIKANKKTIKKYSPGGKDGAQEYSQVVQKIAKQAYLDLESGNRALDQNNPKQALKLANQGLTLEPNEGHLYLLKADAEIDLNNYQDALKDLDKAIQLNPNYYDYYSARAHVLTQLGYTKEAKLDQQTSHTLYPGQDKG